MKRILTKTQFMIACICFISPVGFVFSWYVHLMSGAWRVPLGGYTVAVHLLQSSGCASLKSFATFLSAYASSVVSIHAIFGILMLFAFFLQFLLVYFPRADGMRFHCFLGRAVVFFLTPLFLLTSLMAMGVLKYYPVFVPNIIANLLLIFLEFAVCTYVAYFFARKKRFALHASFNSMAFVYLVGPGLGVTISVIWFTVFHPDFNLALKGLSVMKPSKELSAIVMHTASMFRVIQAVIAVILQLVMLLTKQSRWFEYLPVVVFVAVLAILV